MVSGRANGHPSSLRLDGMDPDPQLPTSETQANGATSSTNHKTRKRAGTELRSVQLRLFEGAAASFFALFGILSSYTAFLCLFLGLLFSALALRLWLLNHHRTKSVATFWCFAVLVPGTLVCLGRTFSELRSRKPHLVLGLRTTDSGATNLLLTNSFLFVQRGPKAQAPDSVATLVVWVPPGRTNAAIKFVAINDSAFRYEAVDDSTLTVDAARIETLVLRGDDPGREIDMRVDSNWRQRDEFGGTLLGFLFPPLLPGNGDFTPALTFTPAPSPSRRLLLMVSLRGKSVPETSHIFYLAFLPSDEVRQPTLFPPGDIAVMILKARPQN